MKKSIRVSLLSLAALASSIPALACPDFTGHFVAQNGASTYDEQITQNGCYSVSVLSTTYDNGVPARSYRYDMYADNVSRPTQNGSQYSYFTYDSLVSVAVVYAQGSTSTNQVVWSLDAYGNKVLTRQSYDQNGQPIGNPTVMTYYAQPY